MLFVSSRVKREQKTNARCFPPPPPECSTAGQRVSQTAADLLGFSGRHAVSGVHRLSGKKKRPADAKRSEVSVATANSPAEQRVCVPNKVAAGERSLAVLP